MIQTVKLTVLLCLFCSTIVSAGEITLHQGHTYRVPDGKYWLVKSTQPLACKVCTEDIQIKGEYSNVEVDGVVFHGEFTLSFSSEHHANVKFYSATRLSLGDSRNRLVVLEKSI